MGDNRKTSADIIEILTGEGVPDDGLTLADITARLRSKGVTTDSVAVSARLFELQCDEQVTPGNWIGGGNVRYWRANQPTRQLEVVPPHG